MNSITITGQLGKDSEKRALGDGTPVLSFSIADGYTQGGEKHTIWWNCAIFGKRAESLAPYLLKGAVVTVVGDVTEKEYKDKTGNDRKAMSVRVSNIALQGGGKPTPGAFVDVKQPAAKPAITNFDDLDVPF